MARTLTYYVACSLDGYIAQRDGSHDGFSQDGDYFAELFAAFPETVPSHLREVMGVEAENQQFDTVLMGRNTYEIGSKVGVTSPYGHLRQYLFSSSLEQSPDEGVELVSGDAIATVKNLKAEAGLGIWLCGGGQLATALFEAQLIDRLILKINPFLMGDGIPLFAGKISQTQLTLTESKTHANGAVMLSYDVFGEGEAIG